MSVAAPVVTACDQSFVPGLGALLRSLQEDNPERPVYVFDSGICPSTRDALEAQFPMLRWKVPVALLNLPSPSVGSQATYARLCIGEEFLDFPRILYLDADTVVTRSLAPLDQVSLGADQIIGACVEPYTPTFSSPNGVRDFSALGFRGHEPYFNAGVMLVHPERWREARITDLAMAYLQRKDIHITLFDQEALNVTLVGRWLALPHEWNVSRYWLKEERRMAHPDILRSARIVHFLSEAKPWSAPHAVHPWLLARYRQFATASDVSS